MIQLVNNGISLQGDADFNGRGFTIEIMPNWAIATVLETIQGQQQIANGQNQVDVKTYNDAMQVANASFGGILPPSTVPKQRFIPDYPSDANGLNPIGTGAGQPIPAQLRDYSAGTLIAAAQAAPVTPTTGLGTQAAQPPAWAVLLYNVEVANGKKLDQLLGAKPGA